VKINMRKCGGTYLIISVYIYESMWQSHQLKTWYSYGKCEKKGKMEIVVLENKKMEHGFA
jgi:hypothetical protein